MNSGKLSADVQTDGNFNAQVNNAAEPGSRPVGGVHGDGRNLDQEGQQFANLLHGSSEAATSSVDAAPGKLPAGQPFESPFSIHLKYPAPGNPEHPAPIGHEHPSPANPEHPAPIGHEHPSPANPERPAPIGHEHPSPANPERPAPIDHEHPASVNPERPAPIGHEHPTIGHEHHESINLAFLTGQERVLPTSPGSGSGVKVENPAVAVADATLPHPQSSTEPMINQPTPATMAGFQSELKSSADPTAKTPHPFVVNERGPAGLSMTQGAEKPVQPPVIPPKEATQPEPAASADSKPETPTGDRILQGLLGQPAQPTTPFLDQPASPVSSGDRIKQIDQLADQLAQRILVSDRSHTTDSEVRIQLRDTVLQGAEITIRRDQGQLVVSFNVADSYVAQQLSPKTSDLQQALSTKLDTPVRIEVNVSSQDTGGQDSPGDGRSRNRRDPNEEWSMEP